jgi:hypothetical protein
VTPVTVAGLPLCSLPVIAALAADEPETDMKMNESEFSATELDAVSGGMKWTPGHKSAYVIDARGGQFSFLGLTFTLDIKGHISSVGPTP